MEDDKKYLIDCINWVTKNPSNKEKFCIDFDLTDFRISHIGSMAGREIVSQIIKEQPFKGWVISTPNIDHVFMSFILRGQISLKRKI